MYIRYNVLGETEEKYFTVLKIIYSKSAGTSSSRTDPADLKMKGKRKMRGKIKEKFRFLRSVCAFTSGMMLACAPIGYVQAEGTEPSVTADSITWDGGLLEVPIDLGSFSAEEVDVSINISESDKTSLLYPRELSEDIATFSLLDLFGTVDEELFFSKAGTYEMTVGFRIPDKEVNDSFNLVVPHDSKQWKVQRNTVEFDGTEDIVFYLENGTNSFEIGKIDGINIFYDMMASYDYNAGYTFNSETGELRIDKEAFIDSLKKYEPCEIDGVTSTPVEEWDEVAVNVSGETTEGIDIQSYINRVDYEGPEDYYIDDAAWRIDLTKLDLSESGGVTSEFTGTSSDEISVSERTGNLISQSALKYMQENYAEQLPNLGYYTVSARLELTELSEKELAQPVKSAFAPLLQERTAGKYYGIEIVADVIKDGKVVDGLENIAVPQLTEDAEVTLKIPENLQKSGRTYELLHYLGGKAEVINCEQKDGMITFRTDSFSPFVLTYRDHAETAENNQNITDSDHTAENVTAAPQTGDLHQVEYAAGVMAVSLTVLAITIYLKRGKMKVNK